MSKIFQALHGAQNEISELLPDLIGNDAPEAEPEPEYSPEYSNAEPAPEPPVAAVPITIPIAAAPPLSSMVPPPGCSAGAGVRRGA
ncbi:MAG TPA: hypothetical protein VIY49_37795 [Bryobacteraceae bacterium]